MSSAYYPFVAGAEVAIKEITDRLPEYEFHMLTPKLQADLSETEQIGRVTVHRVGSGRNFDKYLTAFFGIIKLIKLQQENKFDLFWSVQATYTSGPAYIYNMLFFWKPIPIVLTLQEGELEQKSALGAVNFSWRLAMPRTKYLTAISNYLDKRAREFGFKGPSEVIPNAAAGAFFSAKLGKRDKDKLRKSLGIEESDVVLVTTGRLVEKNDHASVIKALGFLPKEIKLLAIGSGHLRESLRNLAIEYRVSHRVVWLDAIPNEELPKYLLASDIFIRPSLSEGLGISFLEAMAVGLPIIGTNVGGIPDFLIDGETGLFVRVSDPEDIAAKVNLLLSNQSVKEKIAKAGKNLAKKLYSWDLVAPRMDRIFENLAVAGEKFVITSPVAPGGNGPTRYAQELARSLQKAGRSAEVLTFSNTLPTGLRHIWFFLRVAYSSLDADAIIALDNYSVAWSSVWAALLTHKKSIVRVGGDFLWESYANRTGNPVTLARFYSEVSDLNFKEKVIKFLTGLIYRFASGIVFSTRWQRDMTLAAYDIDESKISIIGNHLGGKLPSTRPAHKRYLWIGRDIPLKNVDRLERAFQVAKRRAPDISLELARNITQKEVWDKLANCYVFVLPSISDVSPNLVLEAIQMNKPFILTEECGLVDEVGRLGLLVDPLSVESIADAIVQLSDADQYSEVENRLKAFQKMHTYDDIAREFVAVTNNL